MKLEFFCSKWGKFGKWKTADIERTPEAITAFINEYMSETYQVYDADVCGNIEVEFALRWSNGEIEIWKSEYSWWFEYSEALRDFDFGDLRDELLTWPMKDEKPTFEFPPDRDYLILNPIKFG